MPHRLTLPGPAPAHRYLRGRPGLLALLARFPSSQGWRELLLADRAALLWLCLVERQQRGPAMAWAVLPPPAGSLHPRIHGLQGEGMGFALTRHAPLARQVAFATQALREHGPLWLPHPINAKHLDATFGDGAWEAAMREQAVVRAATLYHRLGEGQAGERRGRL